MNVSDTLNLAVDLIEERGWAQGNTAWGSGNGLCIEGALIAALGGRGMSDRRLLDCPAYTAVEDYLNDSEADVLGIWVWNDRDERTATEVVEVLRATALIEAARERETAEVTR